MIFSLSVIRSDGQPTKQNLKNTMRTLETLRRCSDRRVEIPTFHKNKIQQCIVYILFCGYMSTDLVQTGKKEYKKLTIIDVRKSKSLKRQIPDTMSESNKKQWKIYNWREEKDRLGKGLKILNMTKYRFCHVRIGQTNWTKSCLCLIQNTVKKNEKICKIIPFFLDIIR